MPDLEEAAGAVAESDLPQRVGQTPSFEEVVASGRVGYCVGPLSLPSTTDTADVHADKGDNADGKCVSGEMSMTSEEKSEEGEKGAKSESSSVHAGLSRFTLCCPIGVISHRDGVHACSPVGKESVTTFVSLGYDATTDTSLIQCTPVTGRTHQLRLHLQVLGNPIANDPCYGGVLFYGQPEKRERALGVLRQMRREGKHPLSKVPHLGDAELDAFTGNSRGGGGSGSGDSGSGSSSSGSGGGSSSSGASSSSSGATGGDSGSSCTSGSGSGSVEPPAAPESAGEGQREGESSDAYMVRTCRYCRQEQESQELERLLHCDGIWLHALRYRGKGWSFQAPLPQWAVSDSYLPPDL